MNVLRSSLLPRSSPCWGLLLLGGLGGCGGSSSETPFPQSAHEVAAIPVLQRSQRAKPRPAGPPPTPSLPPGGDSQSGEGPDER
jgi:hypothetical protein